MKQSIRDIEYERGYRTGYNRAIKECSYLHKAIEDDEKLIGKLVRSLRDLATNYGGKDYAKSILNQTLNLGE